MTPATLLPYALVPLILWRVYARIKRLTTRQQSKAGRHWAVLVIFPLLLAMICLGAVAKGQPAWVLAVLGAGLAVGAGLGVVSLRRTRFEQVDQLLFYTPNAHIGILVSLLFIGRLVLRLVDVMAHGPGDDQAAFGPFTMITLGVLAGYYMMYASGVLRYRKAHGIK